MSDCLIDSCENDCVIAQIYTDDDSRINETVYCRTHIEPLIFGDQTDE